VRVERSAAVQFRCLDIYHPALGHQISHSIRKYIYAANPSKSMA
jgi:hypothetical protein